MIFGLPKTQHQMDLNARMYGLLNVIQQVLTVEIRVTQRV